MADPITEAERAKYEMQWRKPEYRERSPAMRVLDEALNWMLPVSGASFCDYGCGTGRASAALAERGYRVTAVDIAANAPDAWTGPFVRGCLWELPAFGQFDHGICCDVLEHIPPEKVADVLHNIADRVRISAFFQIARFWDADGLHLCLRDPDWWAQSFRRAWPRTEFIILEKYLLVLAHKEAPHVR